MTRPDRERLGRCCAPCCREGVVAAAGRTGVAGVGWGGTRRPSGRRDPAGAPSVGPTALRPRLARLSLGHQVSAESTPFRFEDRDLRWPAPKPQNLKACCLDDLVLFLRSSVILKPR